MYDSHAPQLFLSIFLFCFGVKAMTDHSCYDTDAVDMVVPVELSGEEAHLLHDSSRRSARRRGQRSVDSRGGLNSVEDTLFFSLPAFGKDLYLHLKRDAAFLSEGFVVEERGGERDPPKWSHLSRDQLCFYSGWIINHTDSFASLNTCSGLTGLVYTGEDSLFIQPVSSSSDSFSGLQHRVVRHRRSAKTSPPSAPPPGSTAADKQPKDCGTITVRKKEKRQKGVEEGRRRRNAIHLNGLYTVETVVVADSDMVQYHGAEAAQRFLLTVMNMVYNMFNSKSLGVRINIRVTKLVLLHNRPDKLKVGHHGERSLESFCQWQWGEYGGPRYLGNNYVPGGRDDIPPVDTAVLITR
ncbi:A disintegrin and metalloproteinase with thrombospondin motifs 17-like [Salvelinus fontinalis]|uniref:A disintegrin and metalloproteinase with thrombospondin motifs 17-like n=1 Tax=Salvelinus fontinalis TaxID=8038 RepID=UPI0024856459|nr:A disintegrin and metalloproteinase with thrombospondin motifs 17-like [Salvelinus fontinalis]